MEECISLSMPCLQEAQAPVQCRGVQASSLFVLMEEEKRESWVEDDSVSI